MSHNATNQTERMDAQDYRVLRDAVSRFETHLDVGTHLLEALDSLESFLEEIAGMAITRKTVAIIDAVRGLDDTYIRRRNREVAQGS
uniref:Uncharacterized protein n=1 Tax=Mycena chlorophos TaxID=658473 RepID=A0ABQ0KWG5_MYCCL|nr:predicted protein [Mycena chlorophos]